MAENQEVTCLNCEYIFDASFHFCPQCGQANKENKLDFKYFISEFLSANFNLDSKIFQTIKLLLWSPATLTKAFLEGKRTRYITPVRLYLIISLVYFFVLSFDDFSANMNNDGFLRVNVSNENDSTVISNAMDSLNVSRVLDSLAIPDKGAERISELTADSTDIIEQKLVPKLKKLNTAQGRQDFWKLLTEYASLGMFVLMPFSALLLFGLFSAKSYYLQHLILSLHLHSLAFLLFTFFNIVALLISWQVFDILEIILLIVVVVTCLKSYYNLGWGRAIWKSLLFLFLYDVLLLFFFLIIAGASLANL